MEYGREDNGGQKPTDADARAVRAACIGCLMFPLGYLAIAYLNSYYRFGSGMLEDPCSWIPWTAICLLQTGVAGALTRQHSWLAGLLPLLLANYVFWVLGRGVGALGPRDSSIFALMLLISGIVPGVGLLTLLSALRWFLQRRANTHTSPNTRV